MKGRRVPAAPALTYPLHEPGDYGFIGNQLWVFPPRSERYPHAHVAMLDDRWTIESHEDGTVTVSPSIREIGGHDGGAAAGSDCWHGFLRAGVWGEC